MSDIRQVGKAIEDLKKEYPWFENVSLHIQYGSVQMGVVLQQLVPVFQCEDPRSTALRLIDLFQKSIDESRQEIITGLFEDLAKCQDS